MGMFLVSLTKPQPFNIANYKRLWRVFKSSSEDISRLFTLDKGEYFGSVSFAGSTKISSLRGKYFSLLSAINLNFILGENETLRF